MCPAHVTPAREPEGPAKPAQRARPPSLRRGGKPRQRRRGVYRMRCLRMPPDRHPEPGVQVGKVNQASGSSDARRSHQPGDVPSPCSMSIGSRKYKARRAPQTVWIVGRRWSVQHATERKILRAADRLGPGRDPGGASGRPSGHRWYRQHLPAAPRQSQPGVRGWFRAVRARKPS